MPNHQKIVGKVGKDQEVFYCDAGKIKTNRVTYGTTKKVKTVTKKLVKKRNRCVETGVAGRDIIFQCTPCNARQACPKKDDEPEPVKVLCPDYKAKPDCPPCNH